jgi:hypothetical protein
MVAGGLLALRAAAAPAPLPFAAPASPGAGSVAPPGQHAS